MLDVHPPHETVHTWKDFFIHIATIVVGLVIAVGLEQAVEAIHHHHQRHALAEQVRDEAEHNLPFENDSISRELDQLAYLRELRSTLQAGVVSGDSVQVHGLIPRGGSLTHVSPSRSAWAAAKSAGVAELLPSSQAQLYSRRDFNAELEEISENDMYDKVSELLGQVDRAGFHYGDPATARLTTAQRGDILLATDQLITHIEEMIIRLAIERGADQAVASGVLSLDAMYPYQSRSVASLKMGAGLLGGFFGSTYNLDYKPLEPSVPAKP